MVITVIVLAMPLLIWLWLGIAFTILDFTLHIIFVRTGVTAMDIISALTNTDTAEQVNTGRSRIVRYTDIVDSNHPGTLSTYNEEKNILLIDRTLSSRLNEQSRNYLEMTYLKRTMLTDSFATVGFVEYAEAVTP